MIDMDKAEGSSIDSLVGRKHQRKEQRYGKETRGI